MSIDRLAWRLSVEGDAVADDGAYVPLEVLPSRTLTAYLECAGNHRAMAIFSRGGTSATARLGVCERWRVASAVSVLLVGLDSESPEEGFRSPAEIDAPDTLLAHNAKDHGFPLRGQREHQVAWAHRGLPEQKWTRNNTTHYALIGDEYTEGESLGRPATTQVIKSALALRRSFRRGPHPRLRPLAPGTFTRGVEHRLRAHPNAELSAAGLGAVPADRA